MLSFFLTIPYNHCCENLVSCPKRICLIHNFESTFSPTNDNGNCRIFRRGRDLWQLETLPRTNFNVLGEASASKIAGGHPRTLQQECTYLFALLGSENRSEFNKSEQSESCGEPRQCILSSELVCCNFLNQRKRESWRGFETDFIGFSYEIEQPGPSCLQPCFPDI